MSNFVEKAALSGRGKEYLVLLKWKAKEKSRINVLDEIRLFTLRYSKSGKNT